MLLAFSLAAGIASAAAPAAPEPGKYVAGGGWLTIQRAAATRTTFELPVVSPWNGHTCGPMEGEIREGRARVADGDAESACVVTFSAGGDGIGPPPAQHRRHDEGDEDADAERAVEERHLSFALE